MHNIKQRECDKLNLLKECDEQFRNELHKKIITDYFFVKVHNIGYSVLNRPIECYTIGNKPQQILLCGGIHGSEWITCSLLYKLIINICNSIINHKTLAQEKLWEYFKNISLAVIPCLNPDGVEISIHGSSSAKWLTNQVEYISQGDTIHWQSNANGVDLNHNFNADWYNLKKKEIKLGIIKPATTRYGGEAPENQPETIAITEYCRNNQITKAIAFHSQGEEIYWNFGKHAPIESEKIATAMSLLSGYIISQPDSIATGGGLKDWLIDTLKIPAFTVEIGKGKNPLPIKDLPNIYAKTEKMLLHFIKNSRL